jgi:L-methionine (R)-S-oxide reductase
VDRFCEAGKQMTTLPRTRRVARRAVHERNRSGRQRGRQAAVIWYGLPDLNWPGLFLQRGAAGNGSLPRQACLCPRPDQAGRVRRRRCARQSLLVPDVHAFPGHIAYDPLSRSELVMPLNDARATVGVLDLDGPLPSRFDAVDHAACEELVRLYMAHHRPAGAPNRG